METIYESYVTPKEFTLEVAIKGRDEHVLIELPMKELAKTLRTEGIELDDVEEVVSIEEHDDKHKVGIRAWEIETEYKMDKFYLIHLNELLNWYENITTTRTDCLAFHYMVQRASSGGDPYMILDREYWEGATDEEFQGDFIRLLNGHLPEVDYFDCQDAEGIGYKVIEREREKSSYIDEFVDEYDSYIEYDRIGEDFLERHDDYEEVQLDESGLSFYTVWEV